MQPHTNGYTAERIPTVADAMLDQLASWGVERVYGVVGDAILPLISAMAERTSPRFIPTVNEQSAVYMAKADAVLTGGLGVCTATAGPGAANLINGMADAQTDSIAVLAITGQVESKYIGTSYKQAIDQQQLFSAVTEMSSELINPSSTLDVLGELMRKAVAKSKAVHLSVPKDLWQAPLNERRTVRPPEPYLKTPARSADHVVKEAVQLLRQSSRPAILVGVGARSAIGDVLSLAESMRAPIITTLAALGQIPGSHHLNLGSVGEGGSTFALQILAESDLIIRLGTTWWPVGFLPGSVRTIDINVRPEHLGMNTPTAYGIAGLIEEIVPKLLWEAPNWPRPEWEQRVFHARSAWDHSLADEINQGNRGSQPVHPAVLAAALSTHMPQDAVISLDVGDHVLWFNRHFKGTGRQDVLFSGYWRTMGFGLPAAIGAKLAQPYRPSIAIVGDGGLSMSLSEWMTAVRYGLPMTVILFNNRSLAMEENQMEQEGMHTMGVRLHNPDFTGFVKGSGAQAFKVDRVDQLTDVLNQAMNPNGPVLVDVSVQKAPVPPSKPMAFDPRGNRVKVGI